MSKIYRIFFCVTVLLCSVANAVSAQKTAIISTEVAKRYFDEINQATQKHYVLWDMDLYASMLIVNTSTREIYANEPDSLDFLKEEGGIYKGTLPNEIGIANTAIDWGGKKWAMIMSESISKDKMPRITLMAHELFHKAQPKLGYDVCGNAGNAHLDTKDGRIYLRLELEALKFSVLSQHRKDKMEHLRNALIFRRYRNLLFPNSTSQENKLELCEGMAEYTGQVIGGIDENYAGKFFERNIKNFTKAPAFVRSFAYQTIPMYGYLLADIKKRKYWNKEIMPQTNLADYFIAAFEIKLPDEIAVAAKHAEHIYGADSIIVQETMREEYRNKTLVQYRSKFMEQPHIDIALEKMNITFDPLNVVPLDTAGMVYPAMKITDKWGVLRVENGALLHSDWRMVTIAAPDQITAQRITGDGYVLELAQGYTLWQNGRDYEIRNQIEKK